MQLAFFKIPASGPEPAVEELNRFLRTHRVLSAQRELVREDGGTAAWAVCVEYLAGTAPAGGASPNGVGARPAKIDYREVLSGEDFAVFSRLRDLRKRVADREGLPVYAVFSNEQLAAMVTDKADSLAAMAKIEGVGAGRVEKYGAEFLAEMKRPGAEEPAREEATA